MVYICHCTSNVDSERAHRLNLHTTCFTVVVVAATLCDAISFFIRRYGDEIDLRDATATVTFNAQTE